MELAAATQSAGMSPLDHMLELEQLPRPRLLEILHQSRLSTTLAQLTEMRRRQTLH